MDATARSRRSPLVDRRAGVLLHVSSLDAPDGIGDLGPSAHRFLNWLRACGFRAWQMLPIGPVGPGDSPYSAESSFAGEPLFISLDALVEEGFLKRDQLRRARDARGRDSSTTVDYRAARRFKRPLLHSAYERFLERGGARSSAYRNFLRASRWLPAWCAFVERRRESPGEAAFSQFVFDQQWRALRGAAAANDVQLIGDLPIFVAADSADVLEHPELFRLDARGRPTVVTGVPKDDFAPTGQRWGHPHYRWPAHHRSNFAWWRERMRAAIERFDLLRVDHFIGFTRAWEVPASHRTALHGRWRPTPGRALLTAVERDLGRLPLIAEDLGSVTPAVLALRDDFALPGMKLVQNAFWNLDSSDLPHRHPENAVAYPATHDNDTTAGWWRTLAPAVRRRYLDYAGGSAREIVWNMIRLVCTGPARLGVIPMQDLLGLGSHARMNFPGRATRQWRWRLDGAWRQRVPTGRLHRLLVASGRCPDSSQQGDS